MTEETKMERLYRKIEQLERAVLNRDAYREFWLTESASGVINAYRDIVPPSRNGA